MNKIKVLRIIARMNVGGPAFQINNLMNNLNSQDFEQKLVIGECADDEIDYLKLNEVNFPVKYLKGFGKSINLLNDFKSFLNLRQEIKKFKPDIIHTHTTKAGFIGRLAALTVSSKIKLIHTYHGHIFSGYFSSKINKILIILEKILAFNSDTLVAVGNKVKRDLLEYGIGTKTNFIVISPGIEAPKADLLSSRGKKNNQQSLKVLFIGRFTKIKRIDRFLEVVKLVSEERDSVQFVVAGGGSEEKLIHNAIQNEKLPIKLIGWVGDVYRLLSDIDIVLLTSDNEGTPIALIQAGMAAIPVVSTNVGAIEDVVINSKTGFLTTLNTQDLAQKIIDLIDNEKLRIKLGAAAAIYTKENFSIAKFIYKHENLYKSILNRSINL